MKMIVGLGNPGREYEKTRHNTGFMVIDAIIKETGVTLDKSKFKAEYGIYIHKGEKVLLVKPQTYMNLSGQAVQPLLKYYGMTAEDLLVIHDDLDLPVGKLRLRKKGSSGGQKGMGNIIDLLGSNEIKRIRVGISNNKQIDTKDYVLGKISSEDQKEFEKSINSARDAVLFWLDNDFDRVMNNYNN